MLKKPLLIFIVFSSVLTLLFFLLPINLFDGVIVYKEGWTEMNQETPLSLSYFIGVGYDKADMVNVEDFYLTTKGIVMAFIYMFGFPGLLAYRIHLKNQRL